MAKVLHCNDVVPNCDYVAKGESEQEVLQQAAELRTTWAKSPRNWQTKLDLRFETKPRKCDLELESRRAPGARLSFWWLGKALSGVDDAVVGET